MFSEMTQESENESRTIPNVKTDGEIEINTIM